jgi:CRP-like cAMP-binding protein
MSKMKKVIDGLIELDETNYQLWMERGRLVSSKKGEIIFRPDRAFTKLLFLEEGIIRGYRLENGVEYTHHFFSPGWFVSDYQSYLTGELGQLYFQAATDVQFYLFEKEQMDSLFANSHQLERLGRIIAEKAYLKMVERLVDFQTNDLKKRYQNLVHRNPEILKLIPQKHIASYLGVAEQSLSRIRIGLIKD